MKKLLSFIALLLGSGLAGLLQPLIAQTADISIQNVNVAGSTYQFDIYIEPTNNWGNGTFDKRLGDCSWAFTFNTVAINNPIISLEGTGVDPLEGYNSSVQVLGSRLIVTTEFDLGAGNGVDLTNGVEYQLYTIQMDIVDPVAQSDLEWDQINTGIFNIPDVGVAVGYNGSGDIALPVQLSLFGATAGSGFISLDWATESELNNAGFEIYRSGIEAGNYQLIASYVNTDSLVGAGNSNIRSEYHYRDNTITVGTTYFYQLADVDLNGLRRFHGPVSALAQETDIIPDAFLLHQNYPNPFNPETQIIFELPVLAGSPVRVSAIVYDILGRPVRTLVDGPFEPGIYQLAWNGNDNQGNQLSSGTYILRLTAATAARTIKMLLLR